MSDILEQIAAKTKERIAEEKSKVSVNDLIQKINERKQKEAELSKPLPDFLKALQGDNMGYICEIKKASPSKGLIAPEFPYAQIAKEYEAAHASAISCLTEPYWFLGNDKYLEEIAKIVNIPILRKDFTIDDYMIYQARAMGASAVLLIASILDDTQLKDYRQLAEELGLNALVEAHDEEEIKRALESGAKIVGVNNRNLRNFTVSMDNNLSLRGLVPDDIVYVSESGIKTTEDINKLKANRVNAVLIGETLMRSADKAACLRELNGGLL